MPQIDLIRLSAAVFAASLGLASARADEPAAQPQPSQSPSPAASAQAPGSGGEHAVDPGDEEAQREAIMPQREKELIDLFQRARKQYVRGKSGTFAKDVRMNMQVELFRFMGKGQEVEDWIGTILSHGTTPEGNTWLVVEIADGVTLATWQTRVMDGLDRTLIPPYGRLHELARNAKIGEAVSFSGRIVASINDTDDAMISRPQLIMRFRSLRISH